MRSITLFEDEGYVNLLPLVYWRSVFELRIGRKIALDRTAQFLGMHVSGVWTRPSIAPIAAHRCGAPVNQPIEDSGVLVNGRWVMDGPVDLPDAPRIGMVNGSVAYVVCDEDLARRLTPEDMLDGAKRSAKLHSIERVDAPGLVLTYPWEFVSGLPKRLEASWQASDACVESDVDEHVLAGARENIHIGERTSVHRTAILDANPGPIYLSHDASIGAYAVIEGPVYVGPGTLIRPHSWVHGGNAIGPMCKIGGELDGCIVDGYSNKQHAGFLGHSYVGSWVNIGAGACNSDLKNTYGQVRVPLNGTEVDTGMQFFGAILSDHAKVGINGSIPTGACVGFASVVNATRFAPKYVPSFSWVTDERLSAADPGRLLDLATTVMARRDVDMTDEEVELFLELPEIAQRHEARV